MTTATIPIDTATELVGALRTVTGDVLDRLDHLADHVTALPTQTKRLMVSAAAEIEAHTKAADLAAAQAAGGNVLDELTVAQTRLSADADSIRRDIVQWRTVVLTVAHGIRDTVSDALREAEVAPLAQGIAAAELLLEEGSDLDGVERLELRQARVQLEHAQRKIEAAPQPSPTLSVMSLPEPIVTLRNELADVMRLLDELRPNTMAMSRARASTTVDVHSLGIIEVAPGSIDTARHTTSWDGKPGTAGHRQVERWTTWDPSALAAKLRTMAMAPWSPTFTGDALRPGSGPAALTALDRWPGRIAAHLADTLGIVQPEPAADDDIDALLAEIAEPPPPAPVAAAEPAESPISPKPRKRKRRRCR